MSTDTIRKITLPISPEYVSHWGLWEAVREIYQNALDADGAKAEIYLLGDVLHIKSSNGELLPKSLVLGQSSKRDDNSMRGKFGEGYKLALLVLIRMGKYALIHTAGQRWTPRIEFDPSLDTEVLTVEIEESDIKEPGVHFRIWQFLPAEWQAMQENLRKPDDESSEILLEDGQRGRIYVGGLFVAKMENFHAGYSFRPGVIKLDRDRGMVDGFDLAWETSRMWVGYGKDDRVTKLLEDKAPDVQYVEQLSQNNSSIVSIAWGYFTGKHGHEAVPVSTQEEIEDATAAGVKWVLVPEPMRAILRKIGSWFVPKRKKKAIDMLREFAEKHGGILSEEMRRDIDEICAAIEEGR